MKHLKTRLALTLVIVSSILSTFAYLISLARTAGEVADRQIATASVNGGEFEYAMQQASHVPMGVIVGFSFAAFAALWSVPVLIGIWRADRAKA